MTKGTDILIYQILNCIAIDLVRECFRIQATAIAFRTGDFTQKSFGFISLFARFTLLVLFPDDGTEAGEGVFICNVAIFEVIAHIEFSHPSSLKYRFTRLLRNFRNGSVEIDMHAIQYSL